MSSISVQDISPFSNPSSIPPDSCWVINGINNIGNGRKGHKKGIDMKRGDRYHIRVKTQSIFIRLRSRREIPET